MAAVGGLVGQGTPIIPHIDRMRASWQRYGRLAGRSLGPGRARLEFFELPQVCISSEAWVMSMLGTTYGIYDVLGVEGVIRLDTHGLEEGMAKLDFEWSEGKGGRRSEVR